jgi:hypothetical protein
VGQGPEKVLDLPTLARLAARADALDASLLRQGLIDEAAPLASALRATLRDALESAQGADVVRLEDERRKRR